MLIPKGIVQFHRRCYEAQQLQLVNYNAANRLGRAGRQAVQHMWFRKENRLHPEAATKAKAYLDSSAPRGAEVKPLASLFVDDVPHRQTPPLDAPNLSLELRLHNQQAAKFEPDWNRLARNFVINPRAACDISSTYNVLRMRLLKSIEKNCWSTVAVTSPTRRSGNTLTAINLALSIARDLTRSVLLVELDFVNPSFNRILGFEKFRGMADYLLDDAGLSEIVLDIGVDGLTIIPAGSRVANSVDLLSSRNMARFVEELRRLNNHEVVLFDLPSVVAFEDAVAFSPLVDCALLVVEEGVTKVSDVRRALTRLEHTEILGTVLNRSIRGDQ
jgi:protein-tyrosine kinase